MREVNRPFFLGTTALLVALAPTVPAASMQPGRTAETQAKVSAAYDRLVKCGETAIDSKAGTRPGTLAEAKSILGVNCMPEFRILIALTDAWNGQQATVEAANFQLELAAKTLMTQSRTGWVATANAERPAAAAATAVVPATCEGSVKKGTKAFNAGDYDLALCHWLPKAKAGDAAAQNNMGLLFDRGLSAQTPQSDEEAAGWYYLAAQQGVPVAMRNLAAVNARTGYTEAARSWLEMADATELQQRAIRDQRRAQAVAIIAGGLACALGACPGVPGAAAAATSPYEPQSRRVGYGATNSTARSPYSTPDFGLGSSRMTGVGTGAASTGMHMCADGSYVSGPCRMAPDGTYVGGTPRMAPDGTYVGGRPRMAPDGSYVGGTGRTIMCADGTYVVGTRCHLAPNGKYVGQ
jgi:hypothetical protein